MFFRSWTRFELFLKVIKTKHRITEFIESVIKCKYYECLGEKVYIETRNDILKESFKLKLLQKRVKRNRKDKLEYQKLKKQKKIMKKKCYCKKRIR